MLTIEVQEEQKLDYGLHGLATDLSDLRKVARPVTDEVYSVVREQIISKGRSGGNSYPRYADSTLRSITSQNRRRFSHTGEMLNATGTLLRSVGSRGAPFGVYEEAQDSITVGTTLPYARYHQYGTSRMPARVIYDEETIGKRVLPVLKRAYREKIEDRGFDFQGIAEIPF